MLFNSYLFIFIYLPVMLAGWWLLKSAPIRLTLLTFMSYWFYGYWNWKFVPLMLLSTTVDYIAGFKIVQSNDPVVRKRWLVGSLTFNLGILGFYKYAGFFFTTVGQVTRSVGNFEFIVPHWIYEIVLPVGISFYTFNSMSYTIDIYWGRVKQAQSLLHFSAFVAMFPHLVAGPIVRYSDVGWQFEDLEKRLTSRRVALGIFFFVVGLSKKLLLADGVAPQADLFFNSGQVASFGMTWLSVLGYCFQIYFDFSGYSDMAVGLAHLIGLQFPQNFNSPYKAENISQFWRRWHMSLSTWLRDYLYIPLGGSRHRPLRNLIITMFMGGLWHGAQWTFVLWGLFHGLLLVIHQASGKFVENWSLLKFLGKPMTFVCVAFGWVLFRSTKVDQAMEIWASLIGLKGFSLQIGKLDAWYIVKLIICAGIAFFGPNTWEMDVRSNRWWPFFLGILAILSLLFLQKESPFLYFQF